MQGQKAWSGDPTQLAARDFRTLSHLKAHGLLGNVLNVRGTGGPKEWRVSSDHIQGLRTQCTREFLVLHPVSHTFLGLYKEFILPFRNKGNT